MMTLVCQALTIIILVSSTSLFVYGVGAEESTIGDVITFSRTDRVSGGDSRSDVYVQLQLSDDEEETLVSWGLMPNRSNLDWWDRYRAKEALERATAPLC